MVRVWRVVFWVWREGLRIWRRPESGRRVRRLRRWRIVVVDLGELSLNQRANVVQINTN